MPGGFSPVLREAVEARNAALREIVECYWPGLTRHEAARLLSVALARYAAAGWCRDRDAAVCPHDEKSLRGCLWRALRARPRLLSVRQLRRLLNEDDHLANREE